MSGDEGIPADIPIIRMERRPAMVGAADRLHRAAQLSRWRLWLEKHGVIDRKCVECRKPWPCPTYMALKPWRHFVRAGTGGLCPICGGYDCADLKTWTLRAKDDA